MTGRRTLIALTLVVVVLGTAGPATAVTRTRSQLMRARMIYLLNVSRREHGIPPVTINLKLSAYAWQHSRNMAIQNRVYHTSNTWAQIQHYGARSWGENVGMSWDLGVLEHAFMMSPPHRENILAARFRHVGIGVVLTRHYRYVTIDFYG